MIDNRDQLKALFNAVLELPEPARAAFLDEHCRDTEMRREVDRLVAAHGRAGQFLESSGGLYAAAAMAAECQPLVGQRFGPYRLLRELGQGGMGAVYLATRDDAEYRKDVAIKIIRRDSATDVNVRRFRQERQILANLDHPNIARLLDGGTTEEGIPFLVMEVVEGIPIDEHCEGANLSTEVRLELFEQVCGAVSHAHQRGIVHRDLKPSNILVTPTGGLKLLDFGIAKLLESEPLLPRDTTGTLGRMMTPEYASPEQVRGEPATPASDIYSLGVLLYRLLSGGTPYRVTGGAAHDLARAICEQDPRRLTSAGDPTSGHLFRPQRRMSRDLDAIISKAMRKRASDRYTSVGALAEDIRRYRARQPVVARHGSASYRVGRFISRRRIESGVAALAVVALVLFAASWADRVRRANGTVAFNQRTLVLLPLQNASDDSAQEYFVDGLTEALIGQLGTISDVRVISRTSAMRYKRSPKPPAEIARELGADLLVEGEVLRLPNLIRISLRVREAETARILWSVTQERVAREVLALQGDIVRGIASATNISIAGPALHRLTTVRAVHPDVYEAYLKGRYYWNQRTEGSLQRALQHFQQALDLDPTYAPAHVGMADAYNQLGTLMIGTDSPRRFRPAATAAAVKALQIDASLAEAHATLGYVKHYDWEWTDAEQEFTRAIELNPSYALARIWYANLLMSRRRFDEALREVRLARELDPFSLVVNTNVGWILHKARRHDEAVRQFEKTLELDPEFVQARWRLAAVLADTGRFSEAFRVFEPTLAATNRAPSTLARLAEICAQAGDRERARQLLEEIIGMTGHRYVSPGAVAQVYSALNEKELALEWLERAYEERSNHIAYLAVDSVHDPLRTDHRFRDLLRRTGLE
jgi:serine/threonine protein kinase/TolB-like protein/Tfp pilus assembly protein PilF